MKSPLRSWILSVPLHFNFAFANEQSWTSEDGISGLHGYDIGIENNSNRHFIPQMPEVNGLNYLLVYARVDDHN